MVGAILEDSISKPFPSHLLEDLLSKESHMLNGFFLHEIVKANSRTVGKRITSVGILVVRDRWIVREVERTKVKQLTFTSRGNLSITQRTEVEKVGKVYQVDALPREVSIIVEGLASKTLFLGKQEVNQGSLWGVGRLRTITTIDEGRDEQVKVGSRTEVNPDFLSLILEGLFMKRVKVILVFLFGFHVGTMVSEGTIGHLELVPWVRICEVIRSMDGKVNVDDNFAVEDKHLDPIPIRGSDRELLAVGTTVGTEAVHVISLLLDGLSPGTSVMEVLVDFSSDEQTRYQSVWVLRVLLVCKVVGKNDFSFLIVLFRLGAPGIKTVKKGEGRGLWKRIRGELFIIEQKLTNFPKEPLKVCCSGSGNYFVDDRSHGGV